MLGFLEGGYGLAVMAGVLVLGMLDKLLVRRLYKRLIKQSDNMSVTRSKFLKQVKQKFETSHKVNGGVNNTRAFVEKHVNQYRFLGFSLRGINNMSGQAAGLVVLLGVAASLTAYWYDMNMEVIVFYTCAGIIMGIAGHLFDNITDNDGLRSVLVVQLEDYMDNGLVNHLSRNSAEAERPFEEPEPEPAAFSASDQSRKDIEYLKKSLDQIAAGMEPDTKTQLMKKSLSVEEERIIRDIIKEYLS